MSSTHIIAPPNCRVIRAADTTAVSRTRAITWAAANATQVRDAFLDAARDGLVIVGAGHRHPLVQGGSTVLSRRLRLRTGRSFRSSKPVGKVTVIGRVDLDQLRVDLLDGAVEEHGRPAGSCLHLPRELFDAVSGDGGFQPEGARLGLGFEVIG